MYVQSVPIYEEKELKTIPEATTTTTKESVPTTPNSTTSTAVEKKVADMAIKVRNLEFD